MQADIQVIRQVIRQARKAGSGGFFAAGFDARLSGAVGLKALPAKGSQAVDAGRLSSECAITPAERAA
jgi:hypothetical protein